jgi:hypothetical protein
MANAVELAFTTKDTKTTKKVMAAFPAEGLRAKLKRFENGAMHRNLFLLGGLRVLGG